MAVGKMRILLGDDHAVLRAGLRVLLNAEEDIEVVGEAADGQEVMQKVRELSPDIVLLDLSMPRMSGLECLGNILAVCPPAKVLILTMHDDEEYLKAALNAGAKGYILKKAADVELLSAIRMVARGEIFIYPSLAVNVLYQMVIPKKAAPETPKAGSLSEREREVLRYLALGYTNQEIADSLHVSVKTIENYKARLMEKLELRRRAELVRYAMDKGIISR